MKTPISAENFSPLPFQQFSPLFHSTWHQSLRNPDLQVGNKGGPVFPVTNLLSSGSPGNITENRLLPLPASLTLCRICRVGSDSTHAVGRVLLISENQEKPSEQSTKHTGGLSTSQGVGISQSWTFLPLAMAITDFYILKSRGMRLLRGH